MARRKNNSAETSVKKDYLFLLETEIHTTQDDNVVITDVYVTDLFGKTHSLSDSKLKGVRQSMEYWKSRQGTIDGKKYYSNMKYLYQQMLLCMEGERALL